MSTNCTLNNFIKNFDFFPMEVILNIDGEQKKSTTIGGCCSIAHLSYIDFDNFKLYNLFPKQKTDNCKHKSIH